MPQLGYLVLVQRSCIEIQFIDKTLAKIYDTGERDTRGWRALFIDLIKAKAQTLWVIIETSLLLHKVWLAVGVKVAGSGWQGGWAASAALTRTHVALARG